MQIRQNENLKPYSRWQTGGPADYFCQPTNPEELKSAILWADKNKQKISVLGCGTNVLISDEGVEGALISTEKLSRLSVEERSGELKISAEAGVLKSQLCAVFKKRRLAPALFLSGLPGNLGGGLVMNAGTNDPGPFDFSHITERVKVMTPGGEKIFRKEEIKWEYRETRGWRPGVIFEAVFSWPIKEDKNLNQKIKAALKKRRSAQPLNFPSCGSVFKNPKPLFAGRLIEKAGLKGLQRGGAAISEKHGNFIVNLGGASSADIESLIQTAMLEVKKQFGVLLQREVQYLGRGLA